MNQFENFTKQTRVSRNETAAQAAGTGPGRAGRFMDSLGEEGWKASMNLCKRFFKGEEIIKAVPVN